MGNKGILIGCFALSTFLVALLIVPLMAVAFFANQSGGGQDKGDGGEDFSGECKANGVAYALPTSAQNDREAVFGKADGKTKIVSGKFFDKEVQMHEKVMPCLKAVEKDLKAQGTDYTVREPIPSLRWPPDNLGFFHPYGAAVDINQSDNPMCGVFDPKGLCGKGGKVYDIPRSWVKTFEKYGFFWGGNYRTTQDYMHFEWHGEKP